MLSNGVVDDDLGCAPLVPTTPKSAGTPRINRSSLLSRRRLFPVTPSTPDVRDDCCLTGKKQSASSCDTRDTLRNSATPRLRLRILPGSSSKSVVKRLGVGPFTSHITSSPISRKKSSRGRLCVTKETPNGSLQDDVNEKQRIIDLHDTPVNI